MKKGFFRRNFTTILLVMILLTGLGIMAYPTVSDYWNSMNQSQSIAGYQEAVENITADQEKQMLADAKAYNEHVAEVGNRFELPKDELKEYKSLLDVYGTGMIGYLTIDKINVNLAIYHTTDDEVMAAGIGHIEGTSLPIGGKSTHCVLSGHRGLPSARLLTDLDKMEIGDTFVITTLSKTLTYEVDQILIVEPYDTDDLDIIEGEDLCTLVTCTPYGVNSHRLLVRGHRVENASGSDYVSSDGIQIDPVIVTPAVAIPILLFLVIHVMISNSKKKKKRSKKQANGDSEDPQQGTSKRRQ